MRRQVHAVVIVRRRGDRLIQTLQAVREQTRAADTICVVDLTGEPSSEEVFREQLGRDASVSILTGKAQMGWSEALNFARGSLPAEGWVWVLRDDTTPHPEALATLMVTVEGAPSVAIAGPKQRVADQDNWLREFGETLTLWGERQAIVDRELDQGQYDRMSDVMAVGDAGMLVSLGAFDALGGADPALDPLDAPLDLGVRARLAGHRVVAVPQSVVWVERGPADWKVGRNLGVATLYRLDRQAWLYRRFAYAPWWALVPVLLSVIPLALIRSLVQFVLKRPDYAVAEILASVLALLRLPQAIVAGARLGRSNTAGWAAIRALRMSPRDRRRRRQLVAEARFASAEDDARTRVQPHFWPGGIWLIAGLLGLGVLLSGPLLGAQALVGGGLLPLDATLQGLWQQVRWLEPGSVGAIWGERLVPADPAVLLLALVGSLSWWAPSQGVLWFWVGAPLLAGLSAWWAASQLFSRALSAHAFAIVWALSPTFLIALAEGRWHALMLHIALPWLVAAALSAHTSWQRAAQAGFATAVVGALAPLLWPALLIGWIAALVGFGWRHPLRALTGTLPLALAPSLAWWLPRILAPTEIPLLPGFGRWLSDPGAGFGYSEAPWWWLALGWPSPPTELTWLVGGYPFTTVVLIASLTLVTLAAVGLVVARSEITLTIGIVMSAGVVLAAAAPAISQGYRGEEPMAVWPGTASSLVAIAVALGIAALLDTLTPSTETFGSGSSARRTAAAVTAIVAVAVATLAGLGEMTRAWSQDPVVVSVAEARTLPALVAAEAANQPGQRTLVIESMDDGSFRASVEPGSGPTLNLSSSLYRLRLAEAGPSAQEVAELAASLVQPSSAELTDLLESNSIRFVLYRGDPASAAALAMGQRQDFTPAGMTDESVLWQVSQTPAPQPKALVPTTPQRTMDVAWWVVWGLAAVLALPTERRPRRSASDEDDARLATVLTEDPDD